MHFDNREAWLNHVAQRMGPMFTALSAPLPEKVRIAIGFTSTGWRGRSIGECWDNRCSDDGHFEIFIVPTLAEVPDMMPGQVAAILAHELVHAAVGIPAGHGPKFRRVAKGLGLQGKMTATVAGPAFEAAIAPILADAGPLPHGRLKTSLIDEEGPGKPKTTGPATQTNRHIKCKCATCGYTARTSRMWLNQAGPPHCPRDGRMEIVGDESSQESDV